MKSNEFRILGSELGETDSYIDVKIDGIDEDGKIFFAEKNGSRVWDLENPKTEWLMDQNLMIPSDRVDSHALWNRADNVGGERKNTVTDQFADDHTEKAQRALFLAAYFETR